MDKNFYMVMVEGELIPRHKYTSLKKAENKAIETTTSTGKEAWVLQSIKKTQIINNEVVLATPEELQIDNYLRRGYSKQDIGQVLYPNKTIDAGRMHVMRKIRRMYGGYYSDGQSKENE